MKHTIIVVDSYGGRREIRDTPGNRELAEANHFTIQSSETEAYQLGQTMSSIRSVLTVVIIAAALIGFGISRLAKLCH